MINQICICFLSRGQGNNGLERFFYNLAEFVFEYFHDSRRIKTSFAKFFSQIAFRDMMVPFYRYQWRQPAHAQAPTRAFWHDKSLHTPLPAHSFSYAHKVARSPHENERPQVNTWSVLARLRV